MNHLYWSNPHVFVPNPPAITLPPSPPCQSLSDIHHQTTGTSISLNRPRHHLHPQSAPTILNMMKYQNGINHQIMMVNNKKRKIDRIDVE